MLRLFTESRKWLGCPSYQVTFSGLETSSKDSRLTTAQCEHESIVRNNFNPH